jgi:hypothetical protein
MVLRKTAGDPYPESMKLKKRRGVLNPTKRKRAFEALADNFFAASPLQRFLMRGGRGRKLMRAYRNVKNSRRPQCFRQDVW